MRELAQSFRMYSSDQFGSLKRRHRLKPIPVRNEQEVVQKVLFLISLRGKNLRPQRPLYEIFLLRRYFSVSWSIPISISSCLNSELVRFRDVREETLVCGPDIRHRVSVRFVRETTLKMLVMCYYIPSKKLIGQASVKKFSPAIELLLTWHERRSTCSYC